jgi:hypothetical protein
MADITPFLSNESLLLDFMKEKSYPVFNNSNIFLRDLEYAIRDYFRDKEDDDIGTRKMTEYALTFVQAMEKRGILQAQSHNTWILKNEAYRLPKQVEEKKPAETTA